MEEGESSKVQEKKLETTEQSFGCGQGVIPTEGDLLALKDLIREKGDAKKK